MLDAWNPLRLRAEERCPVPLAVFLLLVFMAGTLYTGLHHEPWRDEADAWLAARDLPLSEMVPDWTAHAGTPVLWYLILKAIVGSGFPYVAETLVNLVFAWTAAAVLLFAAPLTRLTKTLFLGSYFMAYEYAVIARSYALAILLIFIAAALFRSREVRPLRFAIVVALLFNVNVHAAIFAALLLALSVTPLPSTARSRGGIAIMIAGALAAWWQLQPRGEANPLAMHGPRTGALAALRDVFLPSSTSAWTALLSLAILAAILFTLRRSPRAMFLLAGAVTGLLVLYTFVWYGGLRASGMILIAAITSIWIASDTDSPAMAGKAAALALNVTLLFSALFTFEVARADIRYAFSGAKEMATFIDHRFDDHEIAAHGFYQAEALLPYLPGRRFWYIGLGEDGTYLQWNAAMRRGAGMPYEVAVLTAKQHFASSKRPWLLLLNRKMPQPERWGFRLIHATPVVVFRNLDERYWLYAPSS